MDDLVYTGSNKLMLEEFKNLMKREFEIIGLDSMRYFPGG